MVHSASVFAVLECSWSNLFSNIYNLTFERQIYFINLIEYVFINFPKWSEIFHNIVLVFLENIRVFLENIQVFCMHACSFSPLWAVFHLSVYIYAYQCMPCCVYGMNSMWPMCLDLRYCTITHSLYGARSHILTIVTNQSC